ncbi:Predicted ABC-type transport system, membrane protein [uncultured Desulfobacterium sp.]|uniref:Predicted ABC-type transport system, membrane protein n=1 Tax=uncultured Desulfobacterium sp. TaxID=201089 RepID=A0A445MWK0_9BACT|nr:Predicted ABC-type transport system, membrane protein [uncultured Desulfobacterium sp.]
MGARQSIQGYVKFFVYMIVVVLINVAGITLFFRVDLTKNGIYSISEASKRVVSTLKEPLTIKVFFSKNLPAPHNGTERYLRDLLEEYAIHANRYFNFSFEDVRPETEEAGGGSDETKQLANSYGIYPIQLQNIEKDELKFQKAYMGLVIIHGDMIEKIPTITTTEGLEYQLTTSIQRLNNKISALLNLEDKIRIRLIMSSSLNIIAPYLRLNDLPTIPEKLKEIVTKLNTKTFDKLAFEYLDPSKDKEIESTVSQYNILSLSWPAISDDNIPAGSGSIGLIMEYGKKTISIPLVSAVRVPLFGTQYSMVDMNRMEDTLNEQIESLLEINEDLGYLADHGTPGASPASMMNPMQQDYGEITNFRTVASQSYTVRDVDLKAGDIPDTFNCLIIAGPKENFSDYELFQIDQFLMRGNNLALFLDAFNEVTPPNQEAYGYNQRPQIVPLDTGLEKLLDHYGVRIKKSYAMDENCYKQRSRTKMGGGETPIYFAPIIKNEFINHQPEFMGSIKEMIMVKASPLEIDAKRIGDNGLAATRLVSTSERSWEMSGRINLSPMMIHPPPSNEMQSLPLAYLIEGEFPSYFAGKPIPEKPQEKKESEGKDKPVDKPPVDKPGEEISKVQGAGQVITKGRRAKIFLAGSSELLKNDLIDEEGKGPNAVFVMNVLDALNNRDQIAVMRGKEQRINPLIDLAPAAKTGIKSFNIAGLPVLVVAFGLVVWARRHSRQKKIRLMFQR